MRTWSNLNVQACPQLLQLEKKAVLITSTQTLGEKRQYSDTRKRQRHPEKWKKNIRKEEYNHGLEHVNTTGKKVPKMSPIVQRRLTASNAALSVH